MNQFALIVTFVLMSTMVTRIFARPGSTKEKAAEIILRLALLLAIICWTTVWVHAIMESP